MPEHIPGPVCSTRLPQNDKGTLCVKQSHPPGVSGRSAPLTQPPPHTRCVNYKTLCDALHELADIEKHKGTEAFVKAILDRKELMKGRLAINHNGISGGGDPKNKNIEDSEFKDPRLPYFVDIEYIEVGYAMTKQDLDATMGYLLWNGIKKTLDVFTGQHSSPLTHRPNAIGLQIGQLIARRYKNIAHFTEEFCKDECSGTK